MSNLMPNWYAKLQQSVEPDAVVLARRGDFYEVLGPKAEAVAKLLGLTITTANRQGESFPMCGFPQRYLEGYLAVLVRHGVRAAVFDEIATSRDCDQ